MRLYSQSNLTPTPLAYYTQFRQSLSVQPVMNSHFVKVGELLRNARRVLFITGAGVSAESLIPTFRGATAAFADGMTEDGVPFEEVLSGETLMTNPKLCWKYLFILESSIRGRCRTRPIRPWRRCKLPIAVFMLRRKTSMNCTSVPVPRTFLNCMATCDGLSAPTAATPSIWKLSSHWQNYRTAPNAILFCARMWCFTARACP